MAAKGTGIDRGRDAASPVKEKTDTLIAPAPTIEERRKALHLSQDRLSQAAAVAKRSIAAAERGRVLSEMTISRLDAALACLERGGTVDEAREVSLALAGVPAVEHKPCPHCLGPVERREGERRSTWLARLTCSAYCARVRTIAGTTRSNHRRAEVVGWPRITGAETLTGKPFAVGEVRTRDYGRAPTMPAADVPSRSAMA